MSSQLINVGGQAVIEGVMMRSPRALAIAVRKPNGEVAVKEAPWKSITARFPWLGKPFLRGVVVLIESLINGIDALTFSANQALDEGDQPEKLSLWAMVSTIGVALAMGILLFVALPHYLSLVLGRVGPYGFGVDSLAFHAIDGAIKMIVFLAYIWLIGRIKDIGRVFEYHGAEHKSIYAYEAGQPLTVENARTFSTLHPRCGTSFILVVLMISILLFAAVFPLITPKTTGGAWGLQAFFIGLKIIMMFPIAGLSYELNRYASKHMDNGLLKALVTPGLWVQHLTTREPSDDQIEIALIALKKALAIECGDSSAS